jgi:hypothetical protein
LVNYYNINNHVFNYPAHAGIPPFDLPEAVPALPGPA